MDGELHFRRVGGWLSAREPGDRRLFATVRRWGQPVTLSNGNQEWFTRSSEPPIKPAMLTLQHGGPVVGQVVQWRSDLLGLDAVLLVHESPGGDGLLALLDKHRELPVSPSFRGTGTRHSTGVQWRHLSIPEIAVCAAFRRRVNPFGHAGKAGRRSLLPHAVP
jgi:hypothetical protein